MKYSLDLSNPWIPQYYHSYKDDESTQTFGAARDLYKVWLAERTDELLKLFATKDDLNFLQHFG